MFSLLRKSCCLCAALSLVTGAFAADHVVARADLHQELRRAVETRSANAARVERFFGSEPVRKALERGRVDYRQVQKAAAMLDDAELERLALRTAQFEKDMAAGALSNQQITYILIALATAVIVLIAVN